MSNDESSAHNQIDELSILNRIISELKPLQPDAQRKIMEAAMTFLGIEKYQKDADSYITAEISSPSQYGEKRKSSFSDHRVMSPKQFLMEKQPESDVERVACLAYYLTHYRDTPHFKAIEISKLNTEAAQRKFSNATYAVDNATKQGYLASAIKGDKQISAFGEMFVQALPDRSAAREIMKRSRPRRKPKDTKIEKKQIKATTDE